MESFNGDQRLRRGPLNYWYSVFNQKELFLYPRVTKRKTKNLIDNLGKNTNCWKLISAPFQLAVVTSPQAVSIYSCYICLKSLFILLFSHEDRYYIQMFRCKFYHLWIFVTLGKKCVAWRARYTPGCTRILYARLGGAIFFKPHFLRTLEGFLANKNTSWVTFLNSLRHYENLPRIVNL